MENRDRCLQGQLSPCDRFQRRPSPCRSEKNTQGNGTHRSVAQFPGVHTPYMRQGKDAAFRRKQKHRVPSHQIRASSKAAMGGARKRRTYETLGKISRVEACAKESWIFRPGTGSRCLSIRGSPTTAPIVPYGRQDTNASRNRPIRYSSPIRSRSAGSTWNLADESSIHPATGKWNVGEGDQSYERTRKR